MKDQSASRQRLRLYRIGLLLAIVLTLIPTALAHWMPLTVSAVRYWVSGLLLVQIIVHLHCFLDIGMRRSERDRLGLVLLAAVVIGLMVGGTLMVFFDQMGRM
jgi:cytochrome o ubiquinol oxidase operon protein cyoD